MPEIGRIFEYKICIYGNEHMPPHFHVVKGRMDCGRFAIEDFRALDKNYCKIKRRTLAEIQAYWSKNRDYWLQVFFALNKHL